MIVNKEVMSDYMFRINLTEGARRGGAGHRGSEQRLWLLSSVGGADGQGQGGGAGSRSMVAREIRVCKELELVGGWELVLQDSYFLRSIGL